MKSNVSNYLELARCVYKDACAKCVADVSDSRDLETIRSRVKNEGISFLTITLPKFAKDFERSLSLGYIDSECFREFRKHQAIPSFLKGMLSQIFDQETGRIYDKTSISYSDHSTIVDSVRQICLTFKKLEIECTPERVASALQEFVKIEHDFQYFVPEPTDVLRFRRVSAVLWDNNFADIQLSDLSPKHGPGATSERISGNQKYVWKYWHDRLEPYFPLVDSAYSISAIDSKELELVTILSEDEELPVRVTPVPKTLKSPRIIAIEPCCMQYTQQAVRDVLYERVERFGPSAGHVNFRDQSVNQNLALIASEKGTSATIDLSEASDRVPLDLALHMFDGNPDLRDAIEACRSRTAILPDGTLIGPLKKFASMGSALCFPIESMYFYTICVMAQLEIHDLPVTHANVLKCSRDVYVYGDDIIIPSTNATVTLNYLQKYNCKVNMSKTFCSGRFRESCGMDAYGGVRVTPVYLRRVPPKSKQQADSLISWVKTGNLFYEKGYWFTAQHIFNVVEKYLGSLPYVSRESAGLGRISFLGYLSAKRWNRKLQRFEVKAWCPSPVYRKDKIGGYAALQKSLSRLGELQNSSGSGYKHLAVSRDALHLERSALHGAVALKLRWVPI